LYVNLSKCSFYQKQIHYLGDIISKKGITMDLEKINAIKEWIEPMNVTKARSFMGLEIY